MRSPFAEAVVKTLYPEIETFSAGTESNLNEMYHSRAIGLASEWGIIMESGRVKELQQVSSFLKSSELVIVAENLMKENVLEFPLNGVLMSFSDLALDNSFTPSDPIGLGDREFKVEMSKVAYGAVRSACNHVYRPLKHRIHVVIPISENVHDLALAHSCFENSIRDGILICVDFRALLTNVPDDLQIIRFNPLTAELKTFSYGSKSCLFLPDREFSHPERIFLSRTWIDLMYKISEYWEVTLLSPPRYLESGKIPDSYLVSIPADTITVINA